MRLDIGWLDLLSGLVGCAIPERYGKSMERTQKLWGDSGDSLITLSVRSSFDLLFRSLRLPAGSEVVMSALTVPDMIEIVRSHGLVPVPVGIDSQGRIAQESLQNVITPRSKMIVVAHLFGGVTPIDPVIDVARQHRLLVVEDCAQSFRGIDEAAEPFRSDVAMYSFGPIKTATALGGAVVRVASPALRECMDSVAKEDPIQTRFAFVKRIFRFGLLKWLSIPAVARYFCACVEWVGGDFDRLANSFARGFEPNRLFTQIRKRPSKPLLRLLRRRWQSYDDSRIRRRIEMGERLDPWLGIEHAAGHSYWVYPVFVKAPTDVCERLRQAGFDATMRSRMTLVPSQGVGDEIEGMELDWDDVLFLPWYPELTDQALHRMAELISGRRNESWPIPGRTDSLPRLSYARSRSAITSRSN